MAMQATAKAYANIALVKYWGKRQAQGNLPEAGSLSLTLEGLSTTTRVCFEGSGDVLWLDGELASEAEVRKIQPILDAIRKGAGLQRGARVETHNAFPTAAGLASSASGMAALTKAACAAAGLSLSPTEQSAIARLGSGSATRSMFGGFVRWHAGTAADGSDSVAEQLYGPEHWDMRVVVAVISGQRKPMSSTRGMLHTQATSPYHTAWVGSVQTDLRAAQTAIGARDWAGLRAVAERSCLRMHADMMAADPPLVYLQPESWSVIQTVWSLRQQGVQLLFTADAGPNIKVFCDPAGLERVRAALAAHAAVSQTLVARPGSGAHLVT